MLLRSLSSGFDHFAHLLTSGVLRRNLPSALRICWDKATVQFVLKAWPEYCHGIRWGYVNTARLEPVARGAPPLSAFDSFRFRPVNGHSPAGLSARAMAAASL